MDQSPRGFASEDEEATYCLSLLRDGDRNQKVVARERLSQIFERRGLLDEAAQCLESNIREGIRDPRVYQRLAGVYRRQGRHELADEVLQEARRLAERMVRPQPPGARRPGPGRPARPGPPSGAQAPGGPAPGGPAPGAQPSGQPPGPPPSPPPAHPLEAPTAPMPAAAPATPLTRAPDRTAELALDPEAEMPGQSPAPAASSDRPWWLAPPVLVVLILLCGPFALAAMWVRGGYTKRAKVTATAVWAGLMVLGLAAAAVTAQSFVASLIASAVPVGTVPGLGTVPTPIVFGTPPPAAASPKPAGGPVGAPTPPPIAASPGALDPRPSPVLISPPGAGPAPGAAASPAAAPAAPKPNGERVRVIDTGGTGANMRERPSSTAPIVKTIPEDTVLQVIGADQQAEGRGWRNVRDEGGAQGWIAAELLAPAT